jgi:CheY-like chemotaxis protein
MVFRHILVADDNALSCELIRELLERSGQVFKKFGLQQIFWYRTKLTDLHAQRPPAFGINHDIAQMSFMGYSTLETESSMALPADCGRVTGKPEVMPRASKPAGVDL